MIRLRVPALAVLLTMAACTDDSSSRGSSSELLSDQEEAVACARAQELARLEAEHRACRAMRESIATLPALAGTSGLDERRHHVLGQAKGWPVVFRRAPVRDLAVLPPYFRVLAESLEDPRRAFSTFETLRGRARHDRAEVRTILLPEGYLYADQPELARWLVTHLDLPRLFDDPEIWLMRGVTVHRLVRAERGYRHADGPNEGEMASLLLFDRVAAKRADLFPVLHVDFVPVAAAKGFDRIRIERMTPGGINAKVRYGSEERWFDAVFTAEESRAQLACEVVEATARDEVLTFRERQRVLETAAERLRKAMDDQVEERLMFDEPREEVGQQDGSLRPLWLWAYRQGSDGYSFNQVWYPLFDSQGRPHLPQVCIDFVLDTYERASGTWYGGRNDRRRIVGRIDFERFQMPNRRSVEAVANFFRENPGTFEIWDVPSEERVRFAQRDAFFDYVRDNADRFRVNHVVLIHGPRGGEAHYHSFIVSRNDPITGMPVEVSENAGKPRLRSWHAAMQSGPLRSIRNVMIPDVEWLRSSFSSSDEAVALVGEAPLPSEGARENPAPEVPSAAPN